MIEDLTFLEEGEFTGRDESTKKIIKTLRDSEEPLLKGVSEYVSQLEFTRSNKYKRRSRTASQVIQDRCVTGCSDTGIAFIVLVREAGIPARYVETFYEPWLNWKVSDKNLENAAKFRKNFRKYIDEMINQLENKKIREKEAFEQVYSTWLKFCGDSSVPKEEIENLLAYDGKRVEGHIFVDVLVNGVWRAYEPKKGFTPKGEYVLPRGRYVEVGKGLDFSAVYIKENGIYRKEPANLQLLDETVKLFKG